MLDDGLGDLAAAPDSGRNPGFLHRVVEPADVFRQLLDPDIVIVPDVRRRADGVDAVPICLGDHLDTLRQIGRTVVQAGQHMTVQIDHAPSVRQFRRRRSGQ